MTETYHMPKAELKRAHRDQAVSKGLALLRASLPQDALGPTHGHVRALGRAEALLEALRRRNRTPAQPTETT